MTSLAVQATQTTLQALGTGASLTVTMPQMGVLVAPAAQGPSGPPGATGLTGPIGPAQSQSKTTPTRTDLELSQIGVRVPVANQGLSNNVENGRPEMLPASLLFPGARVNTITTNSNPKDFYQVDPRDAFPGVIHFANTGLTTPTRYDFSIIVPGYSYLVAAGSSPVILDPGRYDLSWGNGEMVPRNCELFLNNGEAALIGGSVSTRYVYLVSAAQAGRFNGRTKYVKEVDGTWTIRGFTQSVAAGASIVLDLSSLASGQFQFSPLQIDGSGSMAIGVGYLGAVTAIKAGIVAGMTSTTADASGGLEVFNVVSGNSTTGTTAQISIKNNYPSLVGIAWELRNLDTGQQRGYTGPRLVRPTRPFVIGQSLAGHLVQGVAGDAYRKRLLAVLGSKVLIIPGTIGGTQAAYTLWLDGGAGGGGIDSDGDPTTMGLPHFWWNDVTNPSGAAGTAGPILTSALSTINKIQLSELPTYIEFNLGQTDTGVFDDTLNIVEVTINPTTARAIFIDAFVQIVATVRAAISARSVALGGPAIPASALPCWIHPLGRRLGQPGPMGWDRVRQAQFAAIQAVPYAFRGPTTDHMELHDGLHNAATAAGQIEQGNAAADCQLVDQYGLHNFVDAGGVTRPIRRGPSIGTITKIDPLTLQIQIVPEDPADVILYPTGVLGPSPLSNALPNWRFADSAAPITSDGTYLTNGLANYANAITATGFTVTGNTMTVTLSAPITNAPVVYYPFDNLPDFTATNGICYIRESVTGRPLNGMFRG